MAPATKGEAADHDGPEHIPLPRTGHPRKRQGGSMSGKRISGDASRRWPPSRPYPPRVVRRTRTASRRTTRRLPAAPGTPEEVARINPVATSPIPADTFARERFTLLSHPLRHHRRADNCGGRLIICSHATPRLSRRNRDRSNHHNPSAVAHRDATLPLPPPTSLSRHYLVWLFPWTLPAVLPPVIGREHPDPPPTAGRRLHQGG